jgi:hypothetical protein
MRPSLFLILFLSFPLLLLAEGHILGGRANHGALLQQLEGGLSLLGREPGQWFPPLGAPDEIYPLRGRVPEEDDILCVYSAGLALYLYENRVWQVQIGSWGHAGHHGDDGDDDGSTGIADLIQRSMEKGPLRFGAGREEFESLLGSPWYRDRNSFVYLLPDRGYPIRLRLFFGPHGLDDIYLFRSDF